MKWTLSFLLGAAILQTAGAFAFRGTAGRQGGRCFPARGTRLSPLAMSMNPSDVAQMDGIIDKLLSSVGTEKFAETIGQNARAVSTPAFFMRVAALSDQAREAGDDDAMWESTTGDGMSR